MPISGCVKEIISLPKELTGLGIPSLLSTYQKLWLGKRSTLKNSYHSPIRQIWNDSKGKHSKADSLLNEKDNIKAAQESLKIDHIQKAKSHFFALESQGLSASTVTQKSQRNGSYSGLLILNHFQDFYTISSEKRTSNNCLLQPTLLDEKERPILPAISAIRRNQKRTNIFYRTAVHLKCWKNTNPATTEFLKHSPTGSTARSHQINVYSHT